jgi:hypothetical protein
VIIVSWATWRIFNLCLLRSAEKRLVVIVAAFAVGVGFVGGFVVFQFYRAWQDEAVEDARRQFQALYSDPNTDLDDLPSDLPRCAQATDCAAAAGWKWVSYVLSHSCAFAQLQVSVRLPVTHQ